MTSSEYKAGLWESQHLYYLRILIFEADHTEVNHWLWNSWKPTVWIARAEHRADPSCTGLQMASGRPHWNPDRVIIIPWFRSLNRGYHSTIFNVVITLHRPPCCHSGTQSLSKVAQFIFFWHLEQFLWPVMVVCLQNCSDFLWRKNVLAIKKNFWKRKAES